MRFALYPSFWLSLYPAQNMPPLSVPAASGVGRGVPGAPLQSLVSALKSALSSLLATWAKRPVRCLLLQPWGTLQSWSPNPEAKGMLQRVAGLRWPTSPPRASSPPPCSGTRPSSHAKDKPRTFFLTYWLFYLKGSSGCLPFSILHISTEHRLCNHPTQKGLPLVTLRGTVLASYLFLSE